MVHTIFLWLGFLVHMKKYAFLILLLLITTIACSKLVLRQPEAHKELEWPQTGGNAGHSNFTPENLSLPLELKWRHRASSALGPSLLVTHDLIVYGTLDGKIEGVKINNGKKVGRIKIRGNFTATCIAYKNFLLIVRRISQPTFQLYDLMNGHSLWKDKGNGVFAEPMVAGDNVYYVDFSGQLCCRSLADGSERWKVELDAQSHTTPAFGNGFTVVGDDEGKVYAVDSSAHIVWKFSTESAVRAGVVVADETVYVGSTDHSFYAINLADGKEKWKFVSGGRIYNTAAVSAEQVIFGGTDHKVYCLNRQEGSLLWTFAAKTIIGTAPLIANDKVFVGSLDKKLYVLDLKTGKLLWSYEAKGRIRTNPVVVNGKLIFASENDWLYCFGEK